MHDLPLGFFSERAATAIGNFIGEFIRIDEESFKGWWKSFLRIRVRLNINKPLVSQMRVRKNGGDWSWINFRYERLPHFCFICGLIGHTEMFCPKPIDDLNSSSEKQFGAWLRAPNRRPSPVTGNRWVVMSEAPDHKTTSATSGEDIVGGTGIHPGTIYKDGQCTVGPLPCHVTPISGMPSLSHDAADNDVAMQQIDSQTLADGLSIVDPKRKRTAISGPSLEPTPAFASKVCGCGSLIAEKSWLSVGLELTAKALWIEWVAAARPFGFGVNTLPIISNADLIIGKGVWRQPNTGVTIMAFSLSRKLSQNTSVHSNIKVTTSVNGLNNFGSKTVTRTQASSTNQSNGDNKPTV
nr:uncharacterized protein LOC109173053 [Ipomoea batatas]GME06899.1 uncharacterized protein LOC109173053 [Ipomoea batatas]